MADDKLDTGIAAIMERKAAKLAKAEERKEERKESGVVNELVIERQPAGLYFCKYSQHGPVPDELKGLFTHKQRIIDVALRRGIPIKA